jgi:flagellar biosynthesis/type III secretory pathway protein FliH
MKQKSILIFTLLLIGFMQLSAQHRHQHGNFDIAKFKQQKANFITSEAGLTEAEAAAFIPLMNELLEKRFELNRQLRQESRKLKQNSNKTEADYERLINLGLECGLKEAQLNKEYYLKFRKTLTAEKVYKCRKAEDKFMKETVYKERRNRQKEK